MKRIDGVGATPDGMFSGGNKAAGIPATRVTADWLNNVQEELVGLVEASGQDLDQSNNAQLIEAIARLTLQTVNSIQTLRNIEPVSTRSISVRGHTFAGDGGDGVFDAVIGAPGDYEDNNGTVIVRAGGDGSKAWVRRPSRGPGWVNSRWFGLHPSNAPAINDAAIHTMLVAAGVRTIFVPDSVEGPYRTSSVFVLAKPALRMYSDSHGMNSGYATSFVYEGPATLETMFTVAAGTIGVEIDGFHLDAGGLAAGCVRVDVATNGSTHCPSLRNLYVRGYVERGVCLGSTSRTEINAGQLTSVTMDRIYFNGGVAGSVGFHINAQNCEWAVASNWFFNGQNDIGHLNHIYAYAGGLCLRGMVSTRANDYAIVSCGSQIIVDGWRSEDRYLFHALPTAIEGPCRLTGILARGAGVLASDAQVQFDGINSELYIEGRLQGSVVAGPANAKYIRGDVRFTEPGAGYVFQGPQAQAGDVADISVGARVVRGSAPTLSLQNMQGVVQFGYDGSGVVINRASGSDAYVGLSSGNAVTGYVSGMSGGLVQVKNSGGGIRYKFASTEFVPGVDESINCGSAALRWSNVYAANGSIVTSDARQKVVSPDIDAAALRAWARIGWRQFKMTEAVEKKGIDGARWHFGLLAQEIKEAFEAEGLDPFAYGLLCYDEWPDQFEDVEKQESYLDESGVERTRWIATGVKRLVKAAGNAFGVRYDEAMSLECALLRSLCSR